MHHRNLGADGPAVSTLGLGTNNFGMLLDQAASTEVVRAALDVGITHFDTAEMYGEGKSEEFLGTALGSRRDDVVIATKFLPRQGETFSPGDLEARMIECVDGSLARLGTDRIDVLYQHYPDADAPLEELASAFDRLIRSGKVLAVGLSNVDRAGFDAAADVLGPQESIQLQAVQIEWNMLQRSIGSAIAPAARARGVSVVPYFPLASGLLTGKYRGGAMPDGSRLAQIPYFAAAATEENMAHVERLTAFAVERDRTLVELAFAWLLAHPEVPSVIAGARTPEQVRSNAESVSWTLSAEELEQVDNLLS